MKHLKIKCLIAITASFFVGVFVHSETTFALVDNTNYNSPVIQKALLTSLYGCYAGGQVNGVVEKLSSFTNFSDLVTKDNSKKVALPTGLTPIKEADQKITCKGLVAGDAWGSGLSGTFEGLLPERASDSLSGKSGKATNKNDKINLLVGMGYKDVGYTGSDGNRTDMNKKCIIFTFNESTHYNSKEITTDQVCANIGDDNKISSFDIDITTGTYSLKQMATRSGSVTVPFFSEIDGKINFYRAEIPPARPGMQPTHKMTSKGVGDTWEDFKNDFIAKAADYARDGFTYNAGTNYGSYKYTLIGNSLDGDVGEGDQGDSRYEFISGGFQYAALRAGFQGISYLSTNGTTYSTFADLSFSREERLEYYIKVMQEFYFDGQDPKNYWICNVTDYSYYGSGFDTDVNIDWADPGKNKNCKLDTSRMNRDNKDKQYNSFGTQWGVDNIFGVTVGTFSSLVENLNAIATWYPKDDEVVDDPDIQDPVDEPGDDLPGNGHLGINDLCLSHDDAASIAWIACPAVDGMAQGNDGIYGWIKGMLTVKPELLSSDSASYEIWSRFRDAANIIFIAIMLVVIFSQVTGFGIDNYGIKKILPRLIVTAVLVNLSFIICQGAVDLSNVIGSALSLWLSDIAVNTGPGIHTGVGFVSILEAVLAGGGSAAAVGLPFGITIATIAGAAAGWWIILVVLAIVLLIALVAILVVFLMLGARQLIVVAAVALAPLAIICYALPNTEKLFKRWLDIFKAALIMFPICSALAGMGQIIQAIVYGSNTDLGMAVALIAAACPFLPFLVLPTLLKSSLKAVGDLGGKLSGLRNKAMGAARSANSALRSTDTYKDAQFQTAMRRNQTRLDKLMAKAKDGELSQSQQMRLNRYQRRAAAFEKEDAERKIYANGGFEAARAAIESSTSKQEVENAATLWGKDHNGYNSDEMYSELSRIMNLEDGQTLSAQDELTMKALMMKMSNGSGYDKKLMAKAISKGSNAGSVAAAAKYMTKNGDVASAISKKDAATAQYLRELNGGGINTRAANGSVVSFSDWYNAERRDTDGNLTGATNAKFVMSEVTTENADFVGQSASVVARSLGMKEIRDENGETQYVYDESVSPNLTMGRERIEGIVKDELLMNSADNNVRKAMMAAAQHYGISVPASSNTAPVPNVNPAPAASAAASVADPTQLNIQHPTPQVQSPVQQTSPQSIRDQILNVQPGELERLKAEADRKMNGGRGPNNGQGPIIFT